MMTLSHTQQILLSLTVITQDDKCSHLYITPLLSLAGLVMLLWRLHRLRFWLKTAYSPLWCVWWQIRDRLTIAGKLLTIGFNALAWGCL